MSEPIPAPDKTVARLIALACFLVFIGCLARMMATESGMEAVGWSLIGSVFLATAYAGAVYRTRFWR